MLWWELTGGSLKPLVIEIVLAVVGPFILHGGDLPVAQPFLRKMVVSLLGIPFVLTVIL